MGKLLRTCFVLLSIAFPAIATVGCGGSSPSETTVPQGKAAVPGGAEDASTNAPT